MVVKCIVRAIEYFSFPEKVEAQIYVRSFHPEYLGTFPSKIHTHKTGETNN